MKSIFKDICEIISIWSWAIRTRVRLFILRKIDRDAFIDVRSRIMNEISEASDGDSDFEEVMYRLAGVII